MDRLDLRLCPRALVDRFGRRVTCPRLPVTGRAARSGHQDMSAAPGLGPANGLFRHSVSASCAALGGETQIQLPGFG